MKPKLFSILKHRKEELPLAQLKNDVMAGVIVAIIALPLSIALAIASGVTPQQGIITAVIAGFLISLLGGSRVQIGGPTGAFVVIIFGIIAKYGLSGLIISTILAGIFMIIMGVFKLGNLIKYIPYPTTTGFTTGIALVLLSTQVKDFFGLNISQVPSEFIPKWISYIKNFSSIDLSTTIVAVIAVLIIILWPKINKTIPGSLMALVLTTLAVNVFSIPVETIGSRFGDISASIRLIDFKALNLSLPLITSLIRPAITIAFLASIESLLSAVVADGMIGKKHNSNMELIAQGVANITCALFGGIPATGAIARTAANIKNGGRTPIAGIVHSLTLLLIMLLFMPLAKMIPMATLAAILVVVSYNMSELKSFKAIFNSTKSDSFVLVVTFILTVLFDLVVAIEVGMLIAMILFMRRMADNEVIQEASKELGIYFNDDDDDTLLNSKKTDNNFADEISVYEISGPLFFGVVNTFLDVLNELSSKTKILILNMDNVSSIDATALNAFNQIYKRCEKQKIKIYISNINEQPKKVLEKSGFTEKIGEEYFFNSIEESLVFAKEKLIKKAFI